METRKRPELGAVILTYISAIVMFILFGPSAYFYWNKCEVHGEVHQIDSSFTSVKYKDVFGEEYIAETKGEYKKGRLEIGDKVKVYYRKNKPTDVHLPGFDGYKPYLLYYILLLMALAAVFIMHRDYLKR